MLSLDRVADLSEDDRAALRALSEVVYPPVEWADWPGDRLEWAAAEWCVRIRSEDGELASHIGVLLREASHDVRPVRVGGIGGVKTHPAARRRGYAALGIRRAMQFFHDQGGVAFALLVCEPRLLGYYGHLGWREFAGRLVVTQRGEVGDFTFLRVMVHPVQS